jgi:hypothetical protein
MNWIKGQQVDNGRYKIVELTSRGEFGGLYKAIDKKLATFLLAQMLL